MHQIITFIVLLGFIYQGYYCQTTTFNATAYALAHRCNWLPCNVPGYPPAFLNYTIDCCALNVPLSYSQPNQTISISMSRLRPIQLTSFTNTVFMLAGGPGGSGWNLFYNALFSIPASLGITIILPDHRGTGLSAPLSCDNNGSQNISTACINYLLSKWTRDGLNQFSITAAAHDLSVQIQSYNADYPGRVGIFAVSYGTLWLDRFLQIYPTVVQSAVMDGVFDPTLSSDSRADLLTSSVGEKFLSYCQLQPACSGFFPATKPAAIMFRKILNELRSDKQGCIKHNLAQYQLTVDKLRNIFFNLIADGSNYMVRTVLPAVIFRLNRCKNGDVRVLKFFFSNPATSLSNDMPLLLFSKVLNYHITQSETWLAPNENEINETTFNSWHDSTIISRSYPSNYFSLRSQWPKYPLDAYYGGFATQSQVLMLSGQLDPSTVFDQASHIASISTKTRTFYAIPLAGHVTVNIAQVGYLCPFTLTLSWLFPALLPPSWSDTQCIQDLPTTIDFVGATAMGRQYSLQYLNVSLPFGV